MDLVGGEIERTKTQNSWWYFDHRRRQHQCTKTQAVMEKETRRTENSTRMAPSYHFKISPIISIFVFLLSVSSSICRARSSASGNRSQDFRPREETEKLEMVRAHLNKINKPAVKTIMSPHGDVIDCVAAHQQPAFDHPRLQGQKPLDPPERPKGHDPSGVDREIYQLWSLSGESCPEQTIPIRRTSEKDVLRASSVKSFGKKIQRPLRRDSSSDGHEHAVGYVSGDQYYGARASINVWAPLVASPNEFSLSQMWVIAGSFGDDLNTIEAGWQVSPELYGDNYPRFFTYWTSDAYQATGCYNLLCSGFVQTNSQIAIGAAISPTSSYSGGQFDISILLWKDPKHGNWWLEFGSGVLVGYWPSFLFTHLANQATMVQFGGEVVNSNPSGPHTTTQMGSGHFSSEGFGKASYFRNLQVVDTDNSLIPMAGLRVLADHPNCYDIQGGVNNVWGNYFYFGGPGKNDKCP